MKFFLFILFSISLFAISTPTSFQSDFIQITTTPNGKKYTYKGRISYSKDSFKWKYFSTINQEVCSNNNKLLVVNYDLEQIHYFKITDKFNLKKILKVAKLYKNNIYVALYSQQKYTISLDSKRKIQSIAFYDNADNKIQILFKNMFYFDTELSKKVLRCKIPGDFELVP